MARLSDVLFSRKLPVELDSSIGFSFGTLAEFLNGYKYHAGNFNVPEFEAFIDSSKEISPLYVALPMAFNIYPERLFDTAWDNAVIALINPGELDDLEGEIEEGLEKDKAFIRKRIEKEKDLDMKAKLESTLPFYKIEYAWAEKQFEHLKKGGVLDDIVSSICESHIYADTAKEFADLSNILKDKKPSEVDFALASLAKIYSQSLDEMIVDIGEDIQKIGSKNKFEGFDRKLFRYYIMPNVLKKLFENSAFKDNPFANPFFFVAENPKEIQNAKDCRGKNIDLPLLAFYFTEVFRKSDKEPPFYCKDYLTLKSELRAYAKKNITAKKDYEFLGNIEETLKNAAKEKILEVFSDGETKGVPYDVTLSRLLNDPELAEIALRDSNIGKSILQSKGIEKPEAAIADYKNFVRWLRRFDFIAAALRNIKTIKTLEAENPSKELLKLKEEYYKKGILLDYTHAEIAPRNREGHLFFYAIDNRHHTKWADILAAGQPGLDQMNELNKHILLRRPEPNKFELITSRQNEETLLDKHIVDYLAYHYSQKGDDRQIIFEDPFSALLATYKVLEELHSDEHLYFKKNNVGALSLREKVLKRIDDISKGLFVITDKDDKLNPKLETIAQSKEFGEYKKNPKNVEAGKKILRSIDEVIDNEFMAYGGGLCGGWADKNKIGESTQFIQRTMIIYDSEVPYAIEGKTATFANHGQLIGSDPSQKDQDIISCYRERTPAIQNLIKEKRYDAVKYETSPGVAKRVEELTSIGIEDISLKSSQELVEEIIAQKNTPHEDPRCLDFYLYDYVIKKYGKDFKDLAPLGGFIRHYTSNNGSKIVYYQTNLIAIRPSLFYVGKCTKGGGFDIYALYSDNDFEAFVKEHGEKVCKLYKQQLEGKTGGKK